MNKDIKLVKQSVTAYGKCPSDHEGMIRRIELFGRTAYKSEDKITGSSAGRFVKSMIEHRHFSVLEHSNICIRIWTLTPDPILSYLMNRLAYHPYRIEKDSLVIAGNMRAWFETLDMLNAEHLPIFKLFFRHLAELYPEVFGECDLVGHKDAFGFKIVPDDEQDGDLAVHSFRVITNRGMTHEIVRHRVLSFTQESTRYVNYGNKGFEIMMTPEILNHWDPVLETFDPATPTDVFNELLNYLDAFRLYERKLSLGVSMGIARDILPHAIKAEICVSGRWSGFKHFIRLRHRKEAHQYIREIAGEFHRYFLAQGLDAFAEEEK